MVLGRYSFQGSLAPGCSIRQAELLAYDGNGRIERAQESGGLIAGMESGIFGLDLGNARMAVEEKLGAPAEGLGPGMRFNDGRCDRQGRFWSGTMFMDIPAKRPLGRLHRYTAHHGVSAPVVSGLLVQNGLA